MEKLFKRKNINLQSFINEEEDIEYFAYNDKLLYYNILIKFGTSVLDYSDENYEEETGISVISYDADFSYSFILFVSAEVVGPLLLYRIILDAIDFIDKSEEDTVLADLEEISTGHIKHSRTDKNSYYENDVSEFRKILNLINNS